MSELKFSKIIEAKHNPKNGCHASEGALLIVEPLQNVPQKAVVQHGFVALAPKRPKSKYGWVKDVPPFTLEEFANANFDEKVLTAEQQEHLNVMLSSVQNLPEGTPVTANYKSRGVIERLMQFTVHKVIFYAGQSSLWTK